MLCGADPQGVCSIIWEFVLGIWQRFRQKQARWVCDTRARLTAPTQMRPRLFPNATPPLPYPATAHPTVPPSSNPPPPPMPTPTCRRHQPNIVPTPTCVAHQSPYHLQPATAHPTRHCHKLAITSATATAIRLPHFSDPPSQPPPSTIASHQWKHTICKPRRGQSNASHRNSTAPSSRNVCCGSLNLQPVPECRCTGDLMKACMLSGRKVWKGLLAC